MWWNAIGLVSMIVVPGVLAAIVLASAARQTGKEPQPVDRPRRPVGLPGEFEGK